MLQTIRWLMSLGAGEERRVHREDAIFGGIVGVLPYVSSEMQRNILSIIFPPLFVDVVGALSSVSVANFELWPNISALDGSRIIPDAIIDLDKPDQHFRVVVEAKLDSEFAEFQVLKQHQYTREAAKAHCR